MKTAKIERVERVTVLLEQEVDFKEEDLLPNKLVNGKLLELSNKRLREIAYENNYLKCTWSGHFEPETKTVKAMFEKDLFI